MTTTQESTLNFTLGVIKNAQDMETLHRYTDRANGCVRRWYEKGCFDRLELHYNRIIILKTYQSALLRLSGKER